MKSFIIICTNVQCTEHNEILIHDEYHLCYQNIKDVSKTISKLFK